MRSVRGAEARSALASAALAACVVGLLGADAGIVWIVTGVWTVRAMARAPLDFAWGLACLGAGMRWGTLGLGDVAVATRLGGPTIVTGPFLVRAGMLAALAGAILGEIRVGGLHARTWGERGASAASIIALSALFLVPGPADPRSSVALLWATATVLLTIVIVGGARVLRAPGWLPSAIAAAGVVLAVTVA